MINLLSYIGFPFSARYVRQLLHEEAAAPDAPSDAPIHVRVESLGGSLLDALQIREDFRLSERPVHVHYTGCSASAATILATGAAHITMSPTALILVHQCMNPVTQYGLMNKEEIAQAIHALKDTSADLQTMDRLVSSIYAQRAGQDHTPEEMHQAMQAARWLTADEALALGLIDEIADIPAPQREDPATPSAASPDALSASLHAQFVALGLPPCPQTTQEPATASAQETPAAQETTTPSAASAQAPSPTASTPSVLSQLIASLKRAIHPQTTTPTNQSTPNPQPNQPPTPMTPTPSLLALLSLDALTPTESGTIELTQDQIVALEDAIAHLQADLQSARADLQAARADLAQADGDTTTDVHPSAQATQDQLPGTDAMNFYNTFNDII